MRLKHIFLIASIVIGVPGTSVFPERIEKAQAVSGIVRDLGGRVVEDAVVRVKATEIAARSGKDGHFVLSGSVPSDTIRVTAWKNGYYVTGADVQLGDTLAELALAAYTTDDNKQYSWIPPSIGTRSAFEELLVQAGLSLAARISVDRLLFPLADHLAVGCRDCHRKICDQWAGSAHALGAKNSRFLTMYNGTDVTGNRSPRTRLSYRGNCLLIEDYGLIGQYVGDGSLSQRAQGYGRDYGVPLRSDPDRAYYGPGYKLDFPQTDGNCAACHLPSAAIGNSYGIDPNKVAGVDAQGSHCDFCHKISAIKLDPVTGLPYENMPGILSIAFARPGPDSQLFFGPYDDVDIGSHTYLPLMKESDICAPCHQASFWGVPIYESFSEWLTSPYPAAGKTCQSCHMKPNGIITNFAPGKGGLERDPETVSSHNFLGAADEELLGNALTMDLSASSQDGQVTVGITITNDRTGHHVPTGSPLRQVILLVEAYGANGRPLLQLDGPTLPEWCGAGEKGHGCYAGLPGKTYAKVLQEWWTEVTPTAAYWNKTRLVSDNRIAAFAADTSFFTFDASIHEEVTVNARLLYRRAFVSLVKQKGWENEDIIMAQQLLTVREPRRLFASGKEGPR